MSEAARLIPYPERAMPLAVPAAYIWDEKQLYGERALERWHCSCGFVTVLHLVIDCARSHSALDDLREHLLEKHPEHDWPFGHCGRCGRMTDYFRAVVAELDTDVWACESHGPKLPTVLDQADTKTAP